jgi:UDPglucose 6-dehydrogenase
MVAPRVVAPLPRSCEVRLAVIGTGYVGLVAGAGFADYGNDVVCVDVDAGRIAQLLRGEIPIHEPGLDQLVERNLAAGRLSFTTEIARAVPGADIVILAVGTPQGEHSGAADMRYVEQAARDVGRAITGFTVVVNKSTVPVGTADRVRAIIAKETTVPFAVASNPEFLKEGDAINDFMKPMRIILGVDDPRASEVLRRLYAPFIRTSDRVIVMDIRSAELTKYAANAMLAVRISFMNEMALLAERVGADVDMVRRGIGSDARIGSKFLFPGVGYGGSCFPKDLRAILHTAAEVDSSLGVIAAAERANEAQKRVLGDRLSAHFRGDLAGKRIAVWGLAFKPETDDIRDAPALVLIDFLLAKGASVVAHDPAAMPHVRARLGDKIELVDTPYAAVSGADALALVTEWKVFRSVDFRRVKEAMRTPAVFDGRNLWDPQELRSLGFTYQGIGRGTRVSAAE